jgi:1,5-anhydro-D-fructose reductase (1,5-anhydro-D-mannitol-forming)
MTIRWGIVGCGDVTEVKSGPAFQRVEGSELVAVMRRHGELAADYARRHGVLVWYDDASALIGDAHVDAVYIATPPGEHARLALAACAAGKPAYVEKPMARNHAECERMVQAFHTAGLPLFVAYYRRALDRFLKARELVQSGALGTITGIGYRFAGPYHRELPAGAYHGIAAASLPWRVQAAHSGGGLFLDLGSHTLDILDFIVAPLAHVQGSAANRASNHDVEDSVAMSFTCGGAPGVASWNFAAEARIDEILITGEAAELRLSTFGDEPVALHHGSAVERFELPNPRHIQEPLIRSIVRALSGKGSCDSTGTSAARTSAVMDAVLASYYGSRADGFWERSEAWPGRRVVVP